jgi:site-specific DNA recombinase
MDFAKMMETFERHRVSFVSVTQHFNTTHSMGRLTLNILLSFAQFEREIIGERIRDKIAASRQKGKWTGGTPILGYDVDRSNGSPKLVINPDEALRVRQIFELYLEHGTLLALTVELDRRGWRSKVWSTRGGKRRGGLPIDKCGLHNLLTNVLYVGTSRTSTQERRRPSSRRTFSTVSKPGFIRTATPATSSCAIATARSCAGSSIARHVAA